VDVAAKLPPRILLGHADTVRLTSTQVSVGDLHAASIDVTLANVELIDRTIGSVSGTLTGVRVPAANGGVATAETVVLEGKGTAATATPHLVEQRSRDPRQDPAQGARHQCHEHQAGRPPTN
jgi:hypothetical protein